MCPTSEKVNKTPCGKACRFYHEFGPVVDENP